MDEIKGAGQCGSSAYPQWGVQETFDRFGNRWGQTATAGSASQPSLQFGTNGLDSSTSNQPLGFTFDPSGNMTKDAAGLTMTYDGENRMTAYNGTASYSYDGDGLRVVRSPSSGMTTVSIYSRSSLIAEYDNGAAPGSPSREYVYNGAGDTTGLLAIISGGTTTYYHQDHLSVRLTTDANGNVLSQQGTYPYGESWYQAGSSGELLFTTYDHDQESGLDYAMARYYNGTFDLFLSPDPVAGNPDDPQSWNRYPYSRNDPIDLTDPTGQSWGGFFMGLFKTIVGLSIAASGDPVAGFMWIGDEFMSSLADGGKPPMIGFGSMPLGTSFNGNPWGSTGGVASSGTSIKIPGLGCEFGSCGADFTDYDSRQTQQQLDVALGEVLEGRVAGLLNMKNHSCAECKYDFGWNSHSGDTWNVCGRTLNADQWVTSWLGFKPEYMTVSITPGTQPSTQC